LYTTAKRVGSPLVVPNILIHTARRMAFEAARLSISVIVFSVVLGAVVGCNSCELPQFEPGTRFLVTVTNDESVCGGKINFSAGETFEIVAGSSVETPGEGCEYTTAAGAPMFRDSQFEFGSCKGRSPLGVECEATLSGCPNGHLFLYPADVPQDSSKISTKYYFNGGGGAGCSADSGCFQTIPVTIERI
jgi:hypothetical protein